ncbi:MAG: TRAP transporter substrate-binding protein DctP [Archangium sp.]|nr:TRAP transporter substrate-binding protein DctP [Archangium sp.]MDP3155617.1 TRAP transporter substrate-binding protein DctP [Archangium sp.]MDP3570777.1 TRAP transporter substrate-binding protein DctP [Archangium sp.]
MIKRMVMMVAVLLANVALAQDVTIKLGTLAPQGSTWHSLLKEMAEKWAEASGGKVKLKIYAGGTQGSEGDMVRKMGVGQLQAASITNIGLHDIVAEPMVFSTPGLFDERDFREVFPKLEAQLNGIVEAKGYVVLSWAQVGTVSIFCTKPYATPEAAADAKFFAWDGDTASVEAFKLVGFRPVVLSSTDIVPSLQTGMINCVSQVPAYVLTARLFDKANQMVDYPWSYLVGATIVKKDAWEKIPADTRAKLVAITKEINARIDAEVKRLNDDAVAAMKKQGLTVVKVESGPWEKAAMRAWPAVRGKVVPEAFFDQVVKLRDEARKSRK